MSATPAEYARSDTAALAVGKPEVRVAVLSERALSVGLGQRDDAPCIKRAKERGVPVVRRSTGGLGVLLAPGDIAWTLVLERTDPRVGRDFSRAFDRLGVGPVRVLQQLGVRAAWLPPRGLPTECCLLSGRGTVLTVAGRAVGGAAQHATRQALLHHGVLPYRLDRELLRDLFGLAPREIDRTLDDWEWASGGLSPTEIAERLLAAFEFDSVGSGPS